MITTVGQTYAYQEKLNREGIWWGGGSEWVGAYWVALGYGSPDNPEQRQFFCERKAGKGQTVLRQQHNNQREVYGHVLTFDRSINAAWLESIHRDGIQMVAPVVKIAKDAYRQAFDEILADTTIRRGAGGKELYPGKSVGLMTAQGCASDGSIHLHVHLFRTQIGVTDDGRVGVVKNCQEFYQRDAEANRRAQEIFALQARAQLGWKTEMVNGRCVVHGVNPLYLSLVGRRQEKILQYLNERGIEPTPHAKRIAAMATREKNQPTYFPGERVPHWQQEVQQKIAERRHEARKQEPSRPSAVLKATANVLTAALSQPFMREKKTFKVHDVEKFLLDTKRRNSVEGHKAAARAIRASRPRSIREALLIAEVAYKEGRKAKTQLRRGDRVVLSNNAYRSMTEEQKAAFTKLVKKHGLVARVVVPGHRQRQDQEQGRSR